MLRAARARRRLRLELRVVPLPRGRRPGRGDRRGGRRRDARARRTRRCRSSSSTSSASSSAPTPAAPRGKTGRSGELPPAARAPARPSVLRDELTRRVAGRSSCPRRAWRAARGRGGSGTEPVRRAPAQPAPAPAPPQPHRPGGSAPSGRSWRCASRCPTPGRRTLLEIDPEQLLTSERDAPRRPPPRRAHACAALRPAASTTSRSRAQWPISSARAGRAGPVSPDQLEHAWLVLDEARLDRAIRRATAEGDGSVSELAHEREVVRAARHAVTTRMERAV